MANDFTMDYEASKNWLKKAQPQLEEMKVALKTTVTEMIEIGRATEIPKVEAACQLLENALDESILPNIDTYNAVLENIEDSIKHYENVAM